MKTEIVVAIIGAVALVVAAIIGVWNKKENSTSKSIRIQQKNSGKNNTQIGIQVTGRE